jgi:hypothetical protein
MTPIPDVQTRSVDTVICNSTLHELWSYGDGDETIQVYLNDKYKQLRPNGRLVIRDVVGPDDKDAMVLMACKSDDGLPNDDFVADPSALSTFARFTRFDRDFRPGESHPPVDTITLKGQTLLQLPLGYAMEFIAKMDYTDNWLSEMHEAFCFWSYADWTRALTDAGFRILPGSHAYVNNWRVTHSFEKRVQLYSLDGSPRPFPVTNMVLVGEKS